MAFENPYETAENNPDYEEFDPNQVRQPNQQQQKATEYGDASKEDQRSQEERIAAFDSPEGSTRYDGSSGRIDNVIGDTSDVEQQLRDYAASKGVSYDQSDLEGILRNTGYQTGGMSLQQALANQMGIYDQRAMYDGVSVGDRGEGGSGSGSSGSGSFTYGGNQPGGVWGDRANTLWDMLMARANQGLLVDRRDPLIASQVNAFNAAQTRNMRDYLDSTAESMGPNANMNAERRMSAENVAQKTGEFQGQLMWQELSARRTEIQNALEQMGGMLSDQQRMALQWELGLIDANLRRFAIESQNDIAANQLAFNAEDRARYYDMIVNGYFR